jgi:putative molybdopterin biosynthesis protein
MVDVAFGVEPAARQFELEFVPMAKERYMLACKSSALHRGAIQELITLLKGPGDLEMVRPVPGYALDDPRTISEVKDIVPG